MLTEELKELISDDFESTFTILSPNRMANMLGPDDFDNLKTIIEKHCGPCHVDFTKTNDLGSDPYDIYFIDIFKK